MKLDFLIIACHADDEVIGCSSVILNEYKKVGVIHMTSSKDERDSIPLKLQLDYYKNFNHEILNLKCSSEIIDELSNVINELNPETVLGHYEDDNHQDHRELAKALNIALRSNRNSVKAYLQYYIEKPFDLENCAFFQVDKEEKKKLLKKYKDYINEKHYKTVLKFNEFCGVYSNMGFAEPFKVKYIKRF